MSWIWSCCLPKHLNAPIKIKIVCSINKAFQSWRDDKTPMIKGIFSLGMLNLRILSLESHRTLHTKETPTGNSKHPSETCRFFRRKSLTTDKQLVPNRLIGLRGPLTRKTSWLSRSHSRRGEIRGSRRIINNNLGAQRKA